LGGCSSPSPAQGGLAVTEWAVEPGSHRFEDTSHGLEIRWSDTVDQVMPDARDMMWGDTFEFSSTVVSEYGEDHSAVIG
jgi:hypothetical protein